MKRMLVLLGLIGMALSTTAFAAQDGAGCGLGAMLFTGQSGMVPNLLAMTTNGMFGNTFSMTSGTSGCKADSVVLREKEQEAFVATTLSELNQEMAQGQGQHLTALASLMGCPAAVHADFARMSQESYGTVFAQSDASAVVVLASLKDEMGRHPTLASSCSRIS